MSFPAQYFLFSTCACVPFQKFTGIYLKVQQDVLERHCIAGKSLNDGEESLRVKAEQSHGEIEDYYSSILHTARV